MKYRRAASRRVIQAVAAALILWDAGRVAHAACNVIPTARTTFRAALGSSSRPFAGPGDWLELSLDARCDGASPGFSGRTADQVVTIVFTPPGAERNVVVLAADCDAISSDLAACEARSDVATARCLLTPTADSNPGAGAGLERVDQRTLRFRFPDTDAALRQSFCRGGAHAGARCESSADCEGFVCPAGVTDDLTFSGPATVAVTPRGAALPCGLASAACSEVAGLRACVDRLFRSDGSCNPSPGETFAHFTALPPPNDYQSLCTEPASVCTPPPIRNPLRMAVDAAGNLLIPMDWRGVRVNRDAVPVARRLRGSTSIEAFQGRSARLLIPGPEVLSSFSPEGVRIEPIFDPQVDPLSASVATFFGTVDADETILRIARQDVVVGQCTGIADAGLPCLIDADCLDGGCGSATCHEAGAPTETPCATNADCASDACGPALFDFSTRLIAGVGPVLAPTESVVALDPVPLDGFSQTAALNSFVLEEAISISDVNGDGDMTDHVVTLVDRLTGLTRPIGDNDSSGRAAARVKMPPFSFPAVEIEGNTVAFLEPETAQGARDANGNGRIFETILRAFRLPSAECGGVCRGEDVLPGLHLAADASPLLNRRSLAVSNGRVFFRRPERDGGTQAIELVSVGFDGSMPDATSFQASISGDGRFVAFVSAASNLVQGDTNEETDVFLRDRAAGATIRVSVDPATGGQIGRGAREGVVSFDGRSVAFVSGDDFELYVRNLETSEFRMASVPPPGGVFRNLRFLSRQLLSGDGRLVVFEDCVDDAARPSLESAHRAIFLHDLDAATTREIARIGEGCSSLPHPGPSISADGRWVAFERRGSLGALEGTILLDLLTGRERVISVAPNGQPTGVSFDGTELALSVDGRILLFESPSPDLVAGDTNGLQDVFAFDRASGTNQRANLDSADAQIREIDEFDNNFRYPVVSGDGRLALFTVGGTALGDYSIALRDLLTGQLAAVDEATQAGLSRDGGVLAFSAGTLLSGSDCLMGVCRGDIFVRQASSADLSGDGDSDDSVLTVVDAAPGAPTAPVALCPASVAAVSAGSVAFLRPEIAGETAALPLCPAGPTIANDLNDDGDTGDEIVHLWRGEGSVENLARAAIDVRLSADWIAALISEAGQGDGSLNDGTDQDSDDSVPQVYSIAGGPWINIPRSADAIALTGSTLAFTAPEATEGLSGADLNGDGDRADRVLQVVDAARAMREGGASALRNVGAAAEEFVAGRTGLVAFRTLERSQGRTPLNGDGDDADGILQVYVAGEDRLVNSGQAVTPCRLEACDPRTPFVVLDDTVRFLTFEADQARDLNGDGDVADLVVQVLNVARASNFAAAARAAGDASPTVESFSTTLASAPAGVCTDTGDACAGDDSCPRGACFTPPGGCVRDLGVPCNPRPTSNEPSVCAPVGFCQPLLGQAERGTCHAVEGTCRSSADCAAGAQCNEGGQTYQRLADPLADRSSSAAVVFTGAGRCLENLDLPCSLSSDCEPGDFCRAHEDAPGEMACYREQGVCASNDDCPTGSTCRQDLIRSTAANSDTDELPDAVDNCPRLANILQEDGDGDGAGNACDAQTCGNGVVEPGEICDDGNLRVGDGCDCTLPICTGGGRIERPRLALSRLGGRPGDERLVLSGRLRLSDDTAASQLPLTTLVGSGAQVVVEDFGSAGRPVFDLSRRTTQVNGPGEGAVCDPTRDGWLSKAEVGGLVYTNRSNALPSAACAPGSAAGLRRIELIDRRATSGTIDFRVFVQRASLDPPVGPLRAIFVLGGDGAASFAGSCAESTFEPRRCSSGREGTLFACRPN